MEEQENKQVFVKELATTESKTWLKPSKKFPLMLFLGRGFLTLIFLGIFNVLAVVLYFVSEFDQSLGAYSIWIPMCCLLIFIPIMWVTAYDYRHRGYGLDDTEVRYKRGVIHRVKTVMPYGRIQHVVSRQGLFHRMFGLGLLEIHTAGQNVFGTHIDGLEIDDVEDLRQAIMARVTQIAGKNNSEVVSSAPN